MADRLSQEAVEALYGTSGAKARVSQEAVEAVYSTSAAKARVSQVAVEALIHVPRAGIRASQVAVEVLTTPPEVDPPFIASVTVVYALSLVGDITVPFISSATVVYAPTLTAAVSEVDVPFIASQTRVFGVFSLYGDRTFIGPGNGGEVFALQLNANGAAETATLAATITATDTLLTLSGDSGMPASDPFVVTIDDEVLYIVPVGAHTYRVRGRGVSNTTPASHTAGASTTWGDSYDMAIEAGSDIAHEFTADIYSSGTTTYPGWLICFDSTQARLSGSRYPFHVTELVGVFDAGSGTTGTNRCDASQPNAVASAAAVSSDCPAALSNPSRVQSDIAAGDVAVVRYTNPEASPLDLVTRSTALMSWFGLKRVDAADSDVTFTDPTGYVVDTDPGVGPFTGSINGEWTPPVLGPGIGPDTGEPTSHDVPYTSVTLPGTDRYFTNPTSGFAEKGWPICVLAVRHENRRVPFWRSWDWRDYSYVYSGFAPDATYCQMLINRNGVVFASVPEVVLPGTQDIDGPDAVWDDGSYYFGASWYVAIFSTPYLVAGPAIGPPIPPEIIGNPHLIPIVTFHGGVATVHSPGGSEIVEGGSGGGINPPGRERFDVQLV